MTHPHQQLIESYFYEVWNQGHIHLLDELLTADYLNHTPSTPGPVPGPAGLKPIVLAMRAGIPDLHYTIEELILQEEKAVVRLRVRGTHTGHLFGTPPTGMLFDVMQVNIEHIRNGRIHAHWRVTDELGLYKQLGLI